MKALLSKLKNKGPWNKGKLMGQKAPLTGLAARRDAEQIASDLV